MTLGGKAPKSRTFFDARSAPFNLARITAGPRGTRKTVGIPGTGISYTTHQSAPSFGTSNHVLWRGVLVLIADGAVTIAVFPLPTH